MKLYDFGGHTKLPCGLNATRRHRLESPALTEKRFKEYAICNVIIYFSDSVNLSSESKVAPLFLRVLQGMGGFKGTS